MFRCIQLFFISVFIKWALKHLMPNIEGFPQFAHSSLEMNTLGTMNHWTVNLPEGAERLSRSHNVELSPASQD